MNIHELIKSYEEMTLEELTVEEVLDDLSELEEFYNPVELPQYIADWLEEAKEVGYSIVGAVNESPRGEVENWLILNNVEKFAKAWLLGYTVEVK